MFAGGFLLDIEGKQAFRMEGHGFYSRGWPQPWVKPETGKYQVMFTRGRDEGLY